MRKIHIFYGHYNITGTDGKGRPSWFDYEKCFKSLLNTFNDFTNGNIKLYLMMDGKAEDNWIHNYINLFDQIFEFKSENGSIESVTNGVYSGIKQIIEQNKIEENDLIYVLENDYLHLNGWVEEIFNLYKTFGNQLSYVSLYDHLDKVLPNIYPDLVSKIYCTSIRHWRTTPSTCGSYITTRKIFLEDFDVHLGNGTPIGDHNKHIYLNENKGRFILSPIPSLSTHCMEQWLAPCIDWEKIANNS